MEQSIELESSIDEKQGNFERQRVEAFNMNSPHLKNIKNYDNSNF